MKRELSITIQDTFSFFTILQTFDRVIKYPRGTVIYKEFEDQTAEVFIKTVLHVSDIVFN